MTKREAEISLLRGEKISHKYYLPGEYIYFKHGTLFDQNNEPIGLLEGQVWNMVQNWSTGWSIFKKLK
jgi:hypothetical protein